MRTLHCKDAGFDCEGVIRAETDNQVLQGAAQHAREAHGVEATPEMASRLKGLIREE